MIEQGTWPSQEWRLPPKQQDGGSNPPVPAIMLDFSDHFIRGQEFRPVKQPFKVVSYALDNDPDFGLSNTYRRQIEYLYKGHFASPHIRSGC